MIKATKQEEIADFHYVRAEVSFYLTLNLHPPKQRNLFDVLIKFKSVKAHKLLQFPPKSLLFERHS